MDPRPHIARVIIPVVIATTAIAVIAPSMPAAAVEPAPADSTTTEPIPTEPIPTEQVPAPDPTPDPGTTDPVVVAPAPTTVVTTSTRRHRRTAADRFIAVARRQLGDRYVYGAAGPRRFDCSGLVLFSLRRSHNRQILRPGLRSARSFLVNFRHRDRVGRHHGRRGDLVVWGNGRHLGIYLGHGRAISALTRRGVSVHRLHAVTQPFTGFLRTRLWRHR